MTPAVSPSLVPATVVEMIASGDAELVLATALPTSAISAAKARTAVARAFAGMPDQVVDDAQLLVSEAVSDVVTSSDRPPDEPIRLTGYIGGTTLRIEVEHEGRRRPDGTDDGRMRLAILEEIAARWGQDVADETSTTWFELDARPA